MARPSFDEHEPHCRRELRNRGFRADDPRVSDECRCNASFWSMAGAANEGLDALLRLADMQAEATASMTA
jgi:hypothetical protein